jgi:hypothetical protein
LKIHLGVYDVPEPEGGSTYDVAQQLEKKYELFSQFAASHLDDIAKHLEESMAGALETTLMRQKVRDPFLAGTEQIDQDFRKFLDEEQMAKLGIPGVPTKAALEGKSIRFKKRVTPQRWVKGQGKGVGFFVQYGPRRPSFIDSGVLQASFKSWVENGNS